MVSKRFLLPIVLKLIMDYREAKASEVPTYVGTENERGYHVLPKGYEL